MAGSNGQVSPPEDSIAPAEDTVKISPIYEHLNELRLRFIYSTIYLIAGCIVGFFVTEKWVFAWILSPIVAIPEAQLQVLGPAEKLTSLIKTSFIVGLFVALPFIVHQFWLFLRPGLKNNERRYLLLMIPASAILFTIGAAFIFFIMLPVALPFLIGLDLGVDIETNITLELYFTFVLLLILAGGLVFQIPLITYFLAKLGIVNAGMLASNRKFAVLGTVFLAAMLTPTGDPLNLMLLALPIYILFEISIFIAAGTYKPRKD